MDKGSRGRRNADVVDGLRSYAGEAQFSGGTGARANVRALLCGCAYATALREREMATCNLPPGEAHRDVSLAEAVAFFNVWHEMWKKLSLLSLL